MEQRKMDIVITMGGLGDRFRAAGYDIPKYMIEVKGRTLFEWSMTSLSGFKEIAEQIIFIVRHTEGVSEGRFIREKCQLLKINNFKIIEIDYLTDGQAATAMLAEKYWNQENELLIYNIDTYVEAGEMKYDQFCGDGFIPCFKAEGDHWSFVKLNDKDEVTEIQEKQRISDNCTIGAYYFRSCDLYAGLYHQYYDSGDYTVNGEKYVAPLYNHLLKQGGVIYISIIEADKVHVLGTPEELKFFEEH